MERNHISVHSNRQVEEETVCCMVLCHQLLLTTCFKTGKKWRIGRQKKLYAVCTTDNYFINTVLFNRIHNFTTLLHQVASNIHQLQFRHILLIMTCSMYKYKYRWTVFCEILIKGRLKLYAVMVLWPIYSRAIGSPWQYTLECI